jgi:broad specificity phosphatase PhoE
MSVLTLVRHGQASYMEEDYDKLSKLGEEQARRLGRYWASRGIVFHDAYMGPAKRHRRTAELVAEQYRETGLEFPELKVIANLDEVDAGYLMRSHLPVLVERDEKIRMRNEAFQNGITTPEAGHLLQALFEEVALHWCRNGVQGTDMESWEHFRGRVWGAIQDIRGSVPRESNVVVFTSGGPISATIAATLDLSPEKALDFLWMTRNASFSEFLMDDGRFHLSAFNAYPHLDEAFLLTYR